MRLHTELHPLTSVRIQSYRRTHTHTEGTINWRKRDKMTTGKRLNTKRQNERKREGEEEGMYKVKRGR